jgi:hypothetical protein
MTDLTAEREQAHAYLDKLTPAQLSAIRSLLESMLDPVARVLSRAPIDDEPFTEEDRQALAEADEWRKHNQPIPLETVLADFGLTLSDWEEMAKGTAPDATERRGSANNLHQPGQGRSSRC